MEGLESNPRKTWKQEDVVIEFPDDRAVPELPRRTLEDAMNEKGVVVIEKGDPTVWGEFNREKFADLPERVVRYLATLTRGAAAYVSFDILADNFESHADRREWHKGLHRTHTPDTMEYLNSNRLRRNKIYPVITPAAELSLMLKELPRTGSVHELSEMIESMVGVMGQPSELRQNYDPLSLSEKVAYARRLTSIFRTFLAYVTEGEGQKRQAA